MGEEEEEEDIGLRVEEVIVLELECGWTDVKRGETGAGSGRGRTFISEAVMLKLLPLFSPSPPPSPPPSSSSSPSPPPPLLPLISLSPSLSSSLPSLPSESNISLLLGDS